MAVTLQGLSPLYKHFSHHSSGSPVKCALISYVHKRTRLIILFFEASITILCQMKLTFEADVDGQPKPVQMRFGKESDLVELRRWRSPARFRVNPHVRDALEYAKLASKRWAYYHRNGETAVALSQLRTAIRRNPRAEVAFMLIARASWHPGTDLVGLAYCRRTWCHRLIVDFVAVHPRVVGQLQGRIRGMGTGLFHGLIQIADRLGIETIWGEATVNSAPFYKKILGADEILDNFFISGAAMERCRRELVRMHQRRT